MIKNLSRNDQEFIIDNILKVKEIYEKDRERFDELSLMSIKRASNFESAYQFWE